MYKINSSEYMTGNNATKVLKVNYVIIGGNPNIKVSCKVQVSASARQCSCNLDRPLPFTV